MAKILFTPEQEIPYQYSFYIQQSPYNMGVLNKVTNYVVLIIYNSKIQ